MLTQTQLKDIITQNLADLRIYSIQSFLTRLIARKQFGGGIQQYRIHDSITDTDVTSLDDFITKLNADSILADYFYYSDTMTGDRTHPTALTLSNFTITLDKKSQEDTVYYSMFGGGDKHIMFLMNYLSDGDTDLPLKLFEVRLISKA